MPPLMGALGGVAAIAITISTSDAVAQETLTAPRFDTVLFWGAEGALANMANLESSAGAGFVTALNGDIGKSGWTITSSAGLGRTRTPLNWTSSYYSSLLLGHQWNGPASYFSFSAGLQHRKNKEYPGGSPTDGKATGLTFQYNFEAKKPDAPYFHSFGSYSSIETQLYFHARLGYQMKRLRLGSEFTFYDNSSNPPAFRYGIFVGAAPLIKNLNVTVSAGYRRKAGEPDALYTTTSFTLPLKLRP